VSVVVLTKPTVSEDDKAQCLDALDKLRAEIESGDTVGFFVLAVNARFEWRPEWAGNTGSVTQTIGQMEVAKQDLIEKYQAQGS
jgi:hypothetical protein